MKILYRKVKCVGSQNSGVEDLFYCAYNKKIYIRQHRNDHLVCWLTATKWLNGFEASSPVKENVVFKIYDEKNNFLFEEHNECYNGDTLCAKKEYPMANEQIRLLANDLKKSLNLPLKTHEEWRTWLSDSIQKYNYEGYDDNWLYCMNTIIDKEYLDTFSVFYGNHEVRMKKEKLQHNISNQEWTEYTLVNPNDDCEEIIGYVFLSF